MTQTSAKIVCDSVSAAGFRITSFEAVFPRIILAEINTHRVFSRVSASSRAIPVEKMIKRVTEAPYIPTHWGKNQKGMRAEQDVELRERDLATGEWLVARDSAVSHVRALVAFGIHKQITNRLIEPFMWHPTLITATEWDNFWHLRDHPAAHPDFRDLASAMRELYLRSEPKQLSALDWHMPYIQDQDYEQQILADPTHPTAVLDRLRKVSVGRCARVSTLTHDGQRDLQADVDLHDKMMAGGHSSPYEHVARPMTAEELEFFKQKKLRWNEERRCWIWLGEFTYFLGNVQGWVQYRKLIPHEDDILGAGQ